MWSRIPRATGELTWGLLADAKPHDGPYRSPYALAASLYPPMGMVERLVIPTPLLERPQVDATGNRVPVGVLVATTGGIDD